jgi:hypothetical protein
VHNRFGVQELQRVANRPNDWDHLIQWQHRSVIQYYAHRRAFEEVRYEIPESTVMVEVQNRDDVRVRSGTKYGVA